MFISAFSASVWLSPVASAKLSHTLHRLSTAYCKFCASRSTPCRTAARKKKWEMKQTKWTVKRRKIWTGRITKPVKHKSREVKRIQWIGKIIWEIQGENRRAKRGEKTGQIDRFHGNEDLFLNWLDAVQCSIEETNGSANSCLGNLPRRRVSWDVWR